jgi:hypothetical protein
MLADRLQGEERVARVRNHPWKSAMDDIIRTHGPLIAAAVPVTPDELLSHMRHLRRKLANPGNGVDATEVMYKVHILAGRGLWFSELRDRFAPRVVTRVHNVVLLAHLEGVDDMTFNSWGPHLQELEYPLFPLDWHEERFETYNAELLEWLNTPAGAGQRSFVPSAAGAQFALPQRNLQPVAATHTTRPATAHPNPAGAEPYLELVMAPDGSGRTVVEGHDLAVRFNNSDARFQAFQEAADARFKALEARGRGARRGGRGGRGSYSYQAQKTGCFNCGATDHYSKHCPHGYRQQQQQQQQIQQQNPQRPPVTSRAVEKIKLPFLSHSFDKLKI